MAEPQEMKIETETNTFKMKGRPCELSAFSFIPTEREDPPERTVFNTPKQVSPNSQTPIIITIYN